MNISPDNYYIKVGEISLISEKGVQLVLDHLKEKQKLKIEAIALSSIDELGVELKKEGTFKKGFIVRHSDNPLQMGSYHMTPVYVEKMKGFTRALVLDSKGEEAVYHFYIAEKIYECLGIKPLVFKPKRQEDAFRCSAFAIRDLLEVSRSPNLLDEIEKRGNVESDEYPDLSYFSQLPLPFMEIPTKASKKFDQYLKLIQSNTESS